MRSCNLLDWVKVRPEVASANLPVSHALNFKRPLGGNPGFAVDPLPDQALRYAKSICQGGLSVLFAIGLQVHGAKY